MLQADLDLLIFGRRPRVLRSPLFYTRRRRKPTDRTLPPTFAPSVPDALSPSPTDKSLESSLLSLSKLSGSYKRLQEIERRMDWTFARKGLECEESVGTVAAGNAKGQAVSLLVVRPLLPKHSSESS